MQYRIVKLTFADGHVRYRVEHQYNNIDIWEHYYDFDYKYLWMAKRRMKLYQAAEDYRTLSSKDVIVKEE